jgi:GNAT superfamily N-acetyltransferase
MSDILDDFAPQVLCDAIEQNAIEGCKAWSSWPQMEWHEDPDMLWTITSIPFPFFNSVFNAHIALKKVEETIATVLARYRARNVPMSWWTGQRTRPVDLGQRLLAHGFVEGSVTAMAVDLHELREDLPAPQELVIEEVLDNEQLKLWCDISASVFEYPDFAKEAWFEMFASLGLGQELPWRHYIARLGTTPVGTASLFLGAGVAGLSSVSTLPEYRRLGVATASSLRALQDARCLGYRIGILFSSAEGRGIYLKLGFQEYYQGHVYIHE